MLLFCFAKQKKVTGHEGRLPIKNDLFVANK